MSGWIKLHREIFESDIWHDVTTFRLFVYLIGNASYRDGVKYKGMILNKGQFVRSYRKLSDDLAYKEGRGTKKHSLSTIKKCVQKLIDEGRITVEETENGTLFTILNYEKYQTDDSDLKHFNALNRLESANVNRTELRTDETSDKLNIINALNDDESETENTLNEKLRTNCELTANELRTRLRNKEIKKYIEDDDNNARVNPFVFFEQEGFGTLGSFVAERLGDLIDTYGETLVLNAMKEAVLHGAKNLKYVEAILKNPNSKRGKDDDKIQQSNRSYGGFATQNKTKEQVYRELEAARRAWGG